MTPVLGLIKHQARVSGRQLVQRSSTAQRAAASARSTLAARLMTDSGFVDVPWYEAQARQRFDGVTAAVRHYLEVGRFEGLSPHPLFEPSRAPEDDSRRMASGYVPFAGFLRRAKSPKARPHPLFDSRTYLAANPKAAGHRFGAWGHFLKHATDDTPLPLPPTIAGVSTEGLTVTWGRWRETAGRVVGGWALQDAVARPPRVVAHHDAAAERRLREEVAGYPLPTADGPLVTVITAVRNRPHQVLEAIASVTAQTLGDWEMIVVDDGSDDTTSDGVAEVARRDPRVRLVRGPGEGVSRARNRGAAQARGRYVAWLDSDNTWAPEYLEIMVRAMSGRRLRAAYAACAMVSGDEVVYREFAGGLEHLAVGNFVDLNVLVVERALLDEVGGFDPELPRAVDYDLVYRLARVSTPGYVPFLAAVYSDDAGDLERISVKQLKTWNYVVRERHVLDWDAVAGSVPQRVAGRVSVLVAGREEWRLLWATVTTLLRHTPADVDLEIVVVDGASSRTPTVVIGGLAALDPRVRVVRTAANYNNAGGRNMALAHSTGEVVVVLASGVTVPSGWLPPLLSALDSPGVVASAPIVTSWDGLVRWAGLVLPAYATLPVPFLAGHPIQDTRGLVGLVDVPALGVGAMAARAADVVAVRGFDPLYIDAYDDADLSLRLQAATGRRCVLVSGTRVVQLVHTEQRPTEVSVQNRRLFAERWRRPEPLGDGLWHQAGLALTGYRLRPPDNIDPEEPDFPHDVVVLEPVLRPVPGRGGIIAAGASALAGEVTRWAVEVPDLPTAWTQLDGFGEELAAALERRGVVAVSRRTSARSRTPTYLDDVVVTLRGIRPVSPVAGRPTLLVTTPRGRPPLTGEPERFDAVLDDALEDADGLAARLLQLVHEVDDPLAPAARDSRPTHQTA